MNLFDTKTPVIGESFDTLLSHKNIKIVRIVSSDNIEEHLYIQDEDEWVVVLEGEAVVESDNTTHRLSKGDTLFITAKTPHRVVTVTNGTIWLAVHIS